MKKQIGLFTAILFAVSTLMMACKAEVHTHTFSSKWTSDETNHWHAATCEHKDEVIDKAKHTFGDWTITKEPTEEAEGSREKSCSVCEHKVTEVIAKLEHTHKFATDWTKDETHHWYAAICGHTTEVSGKAEHTFGNWTTTKEATEEAEGSKERTCTVCGYTATEVIEKLAHTHKFATDWTKDETNHWHASTCGHEVTEGKTAHTFGDWTITKAATEEETGSKERVCDVCKYKDTEVIEKLEHTHKFATEWTSDETNHWHASTCGHEVTEGKTAHTFGDWTTTIEATCTEEGSKTGVCEVCKKEVTEKIDAKGHSYSGSWKNDDKNHWKECTGCKEKLESAEHEYEWTVTKEATCTEEGSKIGVCEVCKKEVSEKIDVKGHSYSRTKNASGHWYECVCGAKKDEAEHNFGIWKVTTDPTDTTEGTSKRVCDICNFEETKQIIPIPEGFVFVKGGTVVGAKNSDVFIEGRTVTLSDFYMGKYEVTQEEYASVMAGQKVTVNRREYALRSNPSSCTAYSTSYTLFNGDVQEKRPVEGVTWYDAVWYCNALSEKKGLTKAYNIEVTKVDSRNHITAATVTLNKKATGYRLPTEAEWEYAARGGDPTKDDWNYVFSGADTAEGVSYESDKNAGLDSVGWYSYNSINGTTGDTRPSSVEQGYGTHQVGKKAPNRLGLYDMSGNVWEWCYDWYGTVNTGKESDPTGADSGSDRVDRGGSWSYGAGRASVSYRDGVGDPGISWDNLGFRVVRQAN